MPRKSGTTEKLTIDALKHKDKRVNIPTEELKSFVLKDENSPKTMLYPRDSSLDPQLVWKGKDELDREDLEVPIVPIYIQEKIRPHTIIENVKAEAERGSAQQASLFDDFNGIEFQDLVDFYHHEQNWTNRMILGDSLQVMTSLVEKEGLRGKVQMIYLDPPYGIKFGSNWQISTRKREVKDTIGDATRQPEQVKAYRDTWNLGIHSYLSYLRDRVAISRELLSDSGSIFVQIGVENVHLVRCLLDEIFGSENFIGLITFQKTGGIASNFLGGTVDYIIWYGKNKEISKYRQLYLPRKKGDPSLDRYDYCENGDGTLQRIPAKAIRGEEPLPVGRRCRLTTLLSDGESKESKPFEFGGELFTCRRGKHWKTDPEIGGRKLVAAGRIVRQGSTIWYKRYVDDFSMIPLNDRWESLQIGTELNYVVQTSSQVIQRCMLMTTDPGDLVFDPTCGSGTTAYVAEKWGRRWITCDTSRVAIALSRTRLMSSVFPYYILVDSLEGKKKETDMYGNGNPGVHTSNDVRKGFVYKRVPHITLESIANNPGISNNMKPDDIDKAVIKYGPTELLYDQPFEDRSRMRVSGPFTVESLSPHRIVSSDSELPDTESFVKKDMVTSSFVRDMVENLKIAGVSNTVKGEKIKFNELQSFVGEFIHAAGEFAEKGGGSRHVAVSIGPEHGTVGSDYVREAAKEALRGTGFDLLLVCGFAFDGFATEMANEFKPVENSVSNVFAVAEGKRQFGKLPVLLVRMNPDLSIGPDLLKKTDKGQLFMIFGEPDVSINKVVGGRLTVEIRGVDVYDPTTGEIRSHSTDDIACWFIDTAYNGESFFVRQAYFTGANEPYEKLKRALRSEIDESIWSMLYTTVSQPFDFPDTGKIAIKVINHYGDEVLKVFEV